MLRDAAVRTTIRLHEKAKEYLEFRKTASSHINEIQNLNNFHRSAIGALANDEKQLQGLIAETADIPILLQELPTEKSDSKGSENMSQNFCNEKYLQCVAPFDRRILELAAAIDAEEEILDLMVLKLQSSSGFDKMEDFISRTLESGRQIFINRILLKRAIKERATSI